jgi:thioester reductase-like protein
VLSGSDHHGAWDPSHWVPALVQSGVYLGCLPEAESVSRLFSSVWPNAHLSSQSISWIPVDHAASAIVETLVTSADYIHIVHPRPVPWNDIIRPVSKALNLSLVPYQEWLSRLESSISFQRAENEDEKSKTSPQSALRLLHFFRLGLEEGRKSAVVGHETESLGMLPKVTFEKGMASCRTLQRIWDSGSQLSSKDARKWIQYWRNVGVI